jgi:hypothetical protein
MDVASKNGYKGIDPGRAENWISLKFRFQQGKYCDHKEDDAGSRFEVFRSRIICMHLRRLRTRKTWMMPNDLSTWRNSWIVRTFPQQFAEGADREASLP